MGIGLYACVSHVHRVCVCKFVRVYVSVYLTLLKHDAGPGRRKEKWREAEREREGEEEEGKMEGRTSIGSRDTGEEGAGRMAEGERRCVVAGG